MSKEAYYLILICFLYYYNFIPCGISFKSNKNHSNLLTLPPLHKCINLFKLY